MQPETLPARVRIAVAQDKAFCFTYAETLEGFRYVDTSGSDLSAVEKEVQIQKQTAPVKKGDQIGEVIYRLNEKTIGSVPVYATEGVGELTFGGAFLKILEEMMV